MRSIPGFRFVATLGFAIILLGYFLVWLPGGSAGLSFIGLELGEWVKFLPGMQRGDYSVDRLLFYLPPVTLGLLLVVWTMDWPNELIKTWLTRALAVFISLLVFPPLEEIGLEAGGKWLVRLVLIAVVVLAAMAASLGVKLPQKHIALIQGCLFIGLGLAGGVLPSWIFFTLLTEISDLIGRSLQAGPGLWVNAIGHLLMVGLGLYSCYVSLRSNRQELQVA